MHIFIIIVYLFISKILNDLAFDILVFVPALLFSFAYNVQCPSFPNNTE